MTDAAANAIHFRHQNINQCAECSLNPICLPVAISPEDLYQLDSIIQRSRPLHRGDHLFWEESAFEAIYAIKAGSLKAYTTTDAGEEQVTGFYLAGEVVGMDGIHTETHVSSAVALETTSICEIPFDRLQEATQVIPGLQNHFFKLMSREIQADQQLMLLLGKKSADARVASLLLSLGDRYKRRRLSEQRFRLPMSRSDIGNYLGLAVETVSRIFTRMQQQNILSVEGKEVCIIEREQLCRISAGSEDTSCKTSRTGS